MIKKSFKLLMVLFFAIGLCSAILAQETTGSIRGTIKDSEGNLLPGVTITVSSPALMGTKAYVTTETGSFRFPALPPGHYTLTAELAGFKTIKREEIVVRVGMFVDIDITMEMAAIQEEVTVTAASPTVDVEQSKITVVMDKDVLKNIPMARDLYDIVNASPGAISEGMTYRRTSAIHGATVRSNTYAFDGVNMNDPVVMYPLTNINFDVMDEVEIVTAGQTASVGYTDGAYVNVVTKSGGNKFSGGAIVFYTNKGMNQQLWTDEQITSLGVAKPQVDKQDVDGSLTFGGPVLLDKLWFFGNGRYIKSEKITDFIPFTDQFGLEHLGYNWTHQEKMGFVKLTSQLTSNIKLMGMFNYVNIYRPMYEEPGSRTPFISTRVWDHEKGYTGTGNVSYLLNQNTFFDLRVSYVHRWFPIPMQPEVQDLPLIDNLGDLYGGLTTARFNETYLRKRFQVGGYFTRFQDNFLGGNHEFKGGVEYEGTYGDWDWYRKDNMIWYTDSRNANPYYRYPTYGYVAFYICGQDKGSTKIQDKGGRIGAYLQDSATFFGKLTVNAGIRYDRSWGWKPAVNKTQGSALSYWVGENVVSPYIAANYPETWPQGLNPWADATSPDWKDIISWNSWSPRIGFSYDIFGNGKTALKASYSGYTEYLMLQYFSTLHPFYPRSYAFYWWDTNVSNYPDIGDTYQIYPGTDFRGMDPEYAKNRLDPNTKSPINHEFTVGLWHELFKDFSLGVNFIYKTKSNILDDALYSPDTGLYWYNIDEAETQKWWIPFNTTVPAVDKYPAQDVTFYVRRNSPPAPLTFYRFTNAPEVKRKYWAIELMFNKRMSEGWQFGGNIVYSKAYGNIGGWYDQSWGWTGAADNPNYFVNAYGRINIDRPLAIKLWGTAQLPYRIFVSAFYNFQSGGPWNRGTYIRPPAAWCTANNAVQTDYYISIEPPSGERRDRSWNTFDLRFEKEFRIADFGRIGAYIDVVNLLGWSGVGVGLNDTYRWSPTAEGFDQTGTRTSASAYKVINWVAGVRTLKASIRFSF